MIPEMTGELSDLQNCLIKRQFRRPISFANDIIYESAYSMYKIYMLSSIVNFDAR